MLMRLATSFLPLTLLAFGFAAPHIQTAEQNENPKVVDAKAPEYPSIALVAHASGRVLLEVEIDSNGSVLTSRFISGHPLLILFSRKAALGWRFEPSSQVVRKVRLEFDFDIDASRCNLVKTITPYHLLIAPTPPPETLSYIRDDGKTDCEVHRTRLIRDRVQIIYGLVDQPKPYQRAEQKFFPNANSEIFGGCLVETETCDGVERQWSAKYADVLYCPKCRRTQQQWVKKHPPKRTES
ncbi:MAG TPA: energy transducer TonB [Pyrinomonadaceae bacterium]|jgi:hypothetical protein